MRMRPGEAQRWRLANVSNDHFFRLRLRGHRLHVVAQDGNTLDRLGRPTRSCSPPGSGPTCSSGQARAGRSGSSSCRSTRVHEVRTGEPDAERTLEFSEVNANPGFLINGRAFDHDRVDELVRLGRLNEWTLVNRTGENHPFHVHTNDFLVTEVNGRSVPVRGYQDTVLMPRHGARSRSGSSRGTSSARSSTTATSSSTRTTG